MGNNMRERFKKYCDVISGYAFKSEDLLDEGEVPIVKIGNISNGGDIIIDDSTQYVSDDFLQINEKYHIRKRDILISLTGSHINQPNSMVGRTCRSYSDREYLLNQRAGKVIPHNKNTADYLYYLLSSKSIQENIVTRAYGAANQVNISPSAIENIKWEFPNNDTQKKIGSMLSLFDELIVVNNKRIMIFEKMAENLYKEWFVRFRFPGYENTEFESGIPKDWKSYSIKDLCDINKYSLNVKDKDKTITYLDTGSLTENKIDGLEDYEISEAPSRARRLVKKDSILFSTVRPKLRHYGILKDVTENLVVSTGFAVFDVKYDIANIIYLFISSNAVVDYCQTIAEGAVATYPSIKPEEIGRLKVLLPPLEVAEKLNSQLERIYKIKDILEKKNSILIKQRDLFLPRLMSGKLEVK